MDQAIRRKTLRDFSADLKACATAAAARDVVEAARRALKADEYRQLQAAYRAAWEQQA